MSNRLRDKASGPKMRDGTRKVDEGAILRAAEAVNLRQLNGLVLLIISQSAKLGEVVASGANSIDIIEDVSKLSHLVAQAERIKLSQSVQGTSQLNASMARVMMAISESPAPSVRQIEILRLHAQAIAATTRGDDTAAGKVVSALNEAIAGDSQPAGAD